MTAPETVGIQTLNEEIATASLLSEPNADGLEMDATWNSEDVGPFDADSDALIDCDTTSNPENIALIEELYREQYASLYSQALKLTKNQSDAEDNVQACFVRALQSIDRFVDTTGKGHAPWLAWLNRNVFFDTVRRKSHRVKENFIDATPANISRMDYSPSNPFKPKDTKTPEEIIIERELIRQRVTTLLFELGEKKGRRSVVASRLLCLCMLDEGHSRKEIGNILGVAPETVASQKHKILKEIEELVAGELVDA